MRCEVCGRQVYKPFKAIIEGARLTVCKDCAKLGSLSWETEKPRSAKPTAKRRKTFQPKPKASPRRKSPLEPALELVEDFGSRIRQARDSQGLSIEELGKRINEKTSVLKKLESHKMTPSNKLAQKLQYALRIELLVPIAEEGTSMKPLPAAPARSVTLGDLIRNKKVAPEEKKSPKP